MFEDTDSFTFIAFIYIIFFALYLLAFFKKDNDKTQPNVSFDVCINGYAYNYDDMGRLRNVEIIPEKFRGKEIDHPIIMDDLRCKNN
ncbi:hypothetical protein HLB25_10270 [Dickeya dadantii]|uniref:hypothetical protein n=1 Tax=Dickeya dadantii TaxID=204038 RepID=UPI0014961708|nr:hypothetical protein [Dickeya dadantii]NPE55894.1 hypothetical protein [Dickeya dadantii]NPE67118.1 hypothetical protein [Dickeya dadantii]